MNLAKIAIRENSKGIFCTEKASLLTVLLKKRFVEFYDIKLYRKPASEQFVVKKYTINNQKIVIDEES